MDLIWFLRERLAFVDRLYDGATSPFRETLRKIEAEEEPFVYRGDPADVSEPPFLEEWSEAKESLEIIGQWCLNMAYASLKAFLEEYVVEIGRDYGKVIGYPEALKLKLSSTKAKSWFQRYRLFFADALYIDWSQSPMSLDDLEHINLTRDDLIHNVNVTTKNIYQTKKHAERHPKGILWTKLMCCLD